MNYTELKKLDEETLQNLKEGTGPADECICSLLAPEDDSPRKGFRASIKKVFGSIGGGGGSKKQKYTFDGGGAGGGSKKQKYTLDGGLKGNSVDIPLTFTKGSNGIFSTKETVKRTSPCGKCGCDGEDIVLKHTYANIRISAPDISSICSCPSNCLPNAEQLNNNIKVTIEQVQVPEIESEDSEFSEDESTDISTIPEADDSLRTESTIHSSGVPTPGVITPGFITPGVITPSVTTPGVTTPGMTTPSEQSVKTIN